MSDKCQFMNDNGRQCHREAVQKVTYFGDHEHYAFLEPAVRWAKVWACAKHLEAFPERDRRGKKKGKVQ